MRNWKKQHLTVFLADIVTDGARSMWGSQRG